MPESHSGSAPQAPVVRRFPASLPALEHMRRFVEETLTGMGADMLTTYDVVLAVNEIATNTIVHGYRGAPGTIEIELGALNHGWAVCLRDTAPPFDPTSVPAPDIHASVEQRAPGGLGIHLTRAFMDAMIYRPVPGGGNELTLVKHAAGSSSTQEEAHADDG